MWGLPFPDPDPGELRPSEMGWRYWAWSPSRMTLCSPIYRTVWRNGELRALNWTTSGGHVFDLRNICGIHAVRAPVEWWNAENSEIHKCGTKASSYRATEGDIGETLEATSDEINITGLVERFGRYLLGEKGWRAEWVVIRELLAPTNEIGMQLEQTFPDVRIRYMEPEAPPPPDVPFGF